MARNVQTQGNKPINWKKANTTKNQQNQDLEHLKNQKDIETLRQSKGKSGSPYPRTRK